MVENIILILSSRSFFLFIELFIFVKLIIGRVVRIQDICDGCYYSFHLYLPQPLFTFERILLAPYLYITSLANTNISYNYRFIVAHSYRHTNTLWHLTIFIIGYCINIIIIFIIINNINNYNN